MDRLIEGARQGQSLGSAAATRLANPPAVTAGRPWPLGATYQVGADGPGVNFAVFSAHASQVDLCLFDESGRFETARLPLPVQSGDVWHGCVLGLQPGQVYGLRAHGPWRPDRGHRFNPHKLLLDPWAREIVSPPGGFDWAGAHFGADREHPQHMDTRDNALGAHKARVVHDHFDWQDDAPPATPLASSVIYETHVRGLTRQMPGVPEAQRGTYAGLGSSAAIAHFKRLGITAVSLLPVQQILDEAHLAERGMPQLLGLQHAGLLLSRPPLRRHA